MNELQRLRDRNDELEEEVRQLKEDAGMVTPFSKMEAKGITLLSFRILSALLKNDVLRRERLISLLWPDGDEPEFVRESVDVRICRFRKYMAAFGIKVITVRGVGWRLDNESRAKAAALIEEVAG